MQRGKRVDTDPSFLVLKERTPPGEEVPRARDVRSQRRHRREHTVCTRAHTDGHLHGRPLLSTEEAPRPWPRRVGKYQRVTDELLGRSLEDLPRALFPETLSGTPRTCEGTSGHRALRFSQRNHTLVPKTDAISKSCECSFFIHLHIYKLSLFSVWLRFTSRAVKTDESGTCCRPPYTDGTITQEVRPGDGCWVQQGHSPLSGDRTPPENSPRHQFANKILHRKLKMR